jgi:hypothetical protein
MDDRSSLQPLFFSSSANRIARARSLFAMTIHRHAAHSRWAFALTELQVAVSIISVLS